MGDQLYNQYIKSPAWSDFRNRMKKELPYKCVACGKNNRLHLHHLSYRNFQQERPEDVVWMCDKHRRWARSLARKNSKRSIRQATQIVIREVEKGRKARNPKRKKSDPSGHTPSETSVAIRKLMGENFRRAKQGLPPILWQEDD